METWGSRVGAAQVLHIISLTGESGAVTAAAVLGGFFFSLTLQQVRRQGL